jgi:hypothetical protein
MGASFGTAIFGALLTSRLAHHITQFVPKSSASQVNTKALEQSTAALAKLPPAIAHDVLNAFAHAFSDVFLWVVPFALVTFVLSFFLREAPLKTSTKEVAEGEAFEGSHPA